MDVTIDGHENVTLFQGLDSNVKRIRVENTGVVRLLVGSHDYELVPGQAQEPLTFGEEEFLDYVYCSQFGLCCKSI